MRPKRCHGPFYDQRQPSCTGCQTHSLSCTAWPTRGLRAARTADSTQPILPCSSARPWRACCHHWKTQQRWWEASPWGSCKGGGHRGEGRPILGGAAREGETEWRGGQSFGGAAREGETEGRGGQSFGGAARAGETEGRGGQSFGGAARDGETEGRGGQSFGGAGRTVSRTAGGCWRNFRPYADGFTKPSPT